MNCNGICTRYKALKPSSGGRYAAGQKRCMSCEIYINFPGKYCPCCKYRLRTMPRNSKYKAKYRASKEANF